MRIEYDVSWEALMHPEKHPTVFTPGMKPDLRLLAAECARLSYLRAESEQAAFERLEQSLQYVGFGAPVSFSDDDTGACAFCALRASDGLAMVAFRGTQPDNPSDVITDLKFLPSPSGTGRVHLRASSRPRTHCARRSCSGSTRKPGGAGSSSCAATASGQRWRRSSLAWSHPAPSSPSARPGSATGSSLTRCRPAAVMTRASSIAPTWFPRCRRASLRIGTWAPCSISTAMARYMSRPTRGSWCRTRSPATPTTFKRLIAHRGLDVVPVRLLSDHSPINYVRAFT